MRNTMQVFSTCVFTILTSTAQTKVACDVFHQQIRQQDDDQCHHSNARRIEDKAYERTSLSHFPIPNPAIYLTPSKYHHPPPPNLPTPLTWLINHLYNSSVESSMSPSLCEPSLHCVISVVYSSPSNKPGTWNSNRVC